MERIGEYKTKTPIPLEMGASPKKHESMNLNFEKASNATIEYGYFVHKSAHDLGGGDTKIYHTSEHLQTLKRRAERMAETLHLSPKSQAIVEMAIAWHDTIIEYNPVDPKNILSMIGRHRGARHDDKPNGDRGNEAMSAESLRQEMIKANKKSEVEIFSKEQIEIAVWAIHATYPDVEMGNNFQGKEFKEYKYYDIAVNQNSELKNVLEELEQQGITKGFLFLQPHLEKSLEKGKDIPREVLITALSDLGGAGVANNEEFFNEGDAEMKELYANLQRPDIINSLVKGDEEINRNDRKQVAEAFIKWLDSQPGFATWQALRFEKIIYLLNKKDSINPTEEQGLRSQFSHFIDNIRATQDRASRIKKEFEDIKLSDGEKMAFRYLSRELHY